MLKSTRNHLQKAWLALALMGLTVPVLAGGFFLTVSIPERPSQDSVLLVSPQGCGQPRDAKFSASAEGLVNGRRLSLPLDLTMDSSGSYRIGREWPLEGVWVLTVTASYRGLTRSALVELGPDGFARTMKRKPAGKGVAFAGRLSSRELSSGEIDTALYALAAHQSPY